MRSLLRPFFLLAARPLAALSLLSLASCASVVVLPDDGTDDDPSSQPSCLDDASDGVISVAEGGIDFSSAVVGPACGTFAAGSYFGDLVVGGEAVGYAQEWDGWVARLDADGNAAWTRQLAGEGPGDDGDHVYTIVADSGGNSWIIGHGGALDLGAWGTLEGDGMYAMAFDPQGEVRWARRLDRFPYVTELRSDGQLALILADGPVQMLLLDGVSGETTSEITLASGDASVLAATTAGERTALALCFAGEITIGDRTLVAGDDTLDGLGEQTCDLAIAVVDRSGAVIHAQAFTEHGFLPYLVDLAIDERGFVALHASFWGRIDLGLGELSASPIGDGMRGLVAILDDAGGVVSSAAFGDAAFIFGNGLVWDDDGALTLGATLYDGSVNLGGSRIGPVEDAYLGFEARFDATGTHLESRAHDELVHLFPAEPGARLWVDQSSTPPAGGATQGSSTVTIARR